MKIKESDLCANCGTNLYWWKTVKHKKVWVDNADEMYCSKKCFHECNNPTLKEVKEVE